MAKSKAPPPPSKPKTLGNWAWYITFIVYLIGMKIWVWFMWQ